CARLYSSIYYNFDFW
nr:immunoglobulin heavy chain junction region [Macaca mulatta]